MPTLFLKHSFPAQVCSCYSLGHLLGNQAEFQFPADSKHLYFHIQCFKNSIFFVCNAETDIPSCYSEIMLTFHHELALFFVMDLSCHRSCFGLAINILILVSECCSDSAQTRANIVIHTGGNDAAHTMSNLTVLS